VERIKERHPNFGPTFAGEKFKEEGICVSRETSKETHDSRRAVEGQKGEKRKNLPEKG